MPGGDPFRRVQAGDPLIIPARAWNALMGLAAGNLAAGPQRGTILRAIRQASVVSVKNDTGAALARFAVVSITSPIIALADNADAFKERVTFSGGTPTASDAGLFGIVQAPADTDAIVPAVVAGVTIAKVYMNSADDRYADVYAAAPTTLQSGETGAALILYVEAGTGEKWAIVRIGVGVNEEQIAAATGIELAVNKTIDINLSDDLHHFYTLDTRDWRGRHVWIDGLEHSGEPGSNPFNIWDRIHNTNTDGHVQPEAVYHDLSADMWIYTVYETADGDALNAKIVIDGDDGGTLKLEVWDANGDRCQVWIRANASGAKNEDTPDLTAPDP